MVKDKFFYIAKGIGYLGDEECAYQLYQRLASFKCTETEKIEFALRHWGWNGKEREGSKDLIEKMKQKNFIFTHNGEMFVSQFFGIIIPFNAGSVGAHLVFDPYFSNDECYISEIMSIQFGIRMVDIGLVTYYFNDHDYKSESLAFLKTPASSSFWIIELFLGANNKIYYYEPDEGIAGVLSESPQNLFEEVFRFPSATKLGLQPLTRENSLVKTSLLDQIETQIESGVYHPFGT